MDDRLLQLCKCVCMWGENKWVKYKGSYFLLWVLMRDSILISSIHALALSTHRILMLRWVYCITNIKWQISLSDKKLSRFYKNIKGMNRKDILVPVRWQECNHVFTWLMQILAFKDMSSRIHRSTEIKLQCIPLTLQIGEWGSWGLSDAPYVPGRLVSG